MPDAPVTVDLSPIWPGFVVTGTLGATGANTSFSLRPTNVGENFDFLGESGAVINGNGVLWSFEGSNSVEYFSGAGLWPWSSVWTPANGASGTPALARWVPPPVSQALPGATPTVQATMITSLTGTNNDLAFTAVPAGRLGNWIIVRYIAPVTSNAALGVVVTGREITVNLATNGSAQITTTAAQIKTAIEASAAASALVTVANAAGNNGSGAVTAMGDQDLADGEGGLPNPPVTVTL
jgi:hypothetical protein